jgi:hypothetical protein
MFAWKGKRTAFNMTKGIFVCLMLVHEDMLRLRQRHGTRVGKGQESSF